MHLQYIRSTDFSAFSARRPDPNETNHNLILFSNDMSLSELPKELLHQICSYLIEPSDSPGPFLTPASTDSFLALSLACRAVNAVAQSRLHEEF